MFLLNHFHALTHISKASIQLLKRHFGNSRITSRDFPTFWPSRSIDHNPFDFCLLICPINVMFNGPIANLAELKERITQQNSQREPETLQLIVGHGVYWSQFLTEKGEQHTKHVL